MLDDGSDVFLRVPEQWWATYEMTTLGNDRTDPDQKKLQYVGNTDTYDELVGQVRQVAQLQYTQEWSYMEYQQYPPSNPEAGDEWVVNDFDNSPARWVVTYKENPVEQWEDGKPTAYQQYSISDGREYNHIDINYAENIQVGSIVLYAMAMTEIYSKALGIDLTEGFLYENLLAEGMTADFTIVDNSVVVDWDRLDWDLGDAGNTSWQGFLVDAK